MGRHLAAAGVRLVDNRLHLLRRQRFRVDDLDPIDAGVDQLAGLRLRIGRAGDIPRLNGVRVPSFRERRTGDVHRRPGDFSARDALPDGKDWLRRRREIADGCHAGHQHLLRRRGHDDPLELRRVGVEPIARIRMTRVHQMHVEIPQPREHGESFRGHGLVAVRHRQRIGRSDLLDAFAADQDDAVTKRRAACAVDQRAANQRERPAL